MKVGDIYAKVYDRMKHHLQKFKEEIVGSGNSLKTSKFYQMLHVVDYITRYIFPMTYAGSMGENFGQL